MVLLALAGVAPEVIAADYELSAERQRAFRRARPEPDPAAVLATFLAERGTTAGQVIETTLGSIDLSTTLAAGGLDGWDVASVRARLLRIALDRDRAARRSPREEQPLSSRPSRS